MCSRFRSVRFHRWKSHGIIVGNCKLVRFDQFSQIAPDLNPNFDNFMPQFLVKIHGFLTFLVFLTSNSMPSVNQEKYLFSCDYQYIEKFPKTLMS